MLAAADYVGRAFGGMFADVEVVFAISSHRYNTTQTVARAYLSVSSFSVKGALRQQSHLGQSRARAHSKRSWSPDTPSTDFHELRAHGRGQWNVLAGSR